MCVRPLLVRVESSRTGDVSYIHAPCGKCLECVKFRQNSWKLRLCEESRNWLHGWFFTLTYRTDALPFNFDEETGLLSSTARKRDVQLWLKRVRESYFREYGERLKFKYFICAEYGSFDTYVDDCGRVRKGTGRPHYHGCLYTNAPDEFIIPFFLEWQKTYGNVDYSPILLYDRGSRSSTANYVSKYCCKGSFASRQDEIEAGLIEPAWTVCSKNIGLSYVERMRSFHLPDYVEPNVFYSQAEFDKLYRQSKESEYWKKVDVIKSRMFVTDGEYRYKMPRYYRDRLYSLPFVQYRTVTGCCNLTICPFDVQIHYVNPENSITYDSKKVKIKRYSHENLLSRSIAMLTQRDFDVKYQQKFDAVRATDPTLSLDEIYLAVQRNSEIALKYRETLSAQSLNQFYRKNQQKYPTLNFA